MGLPSGKNGHWTWYKICFWSTFGPSEVRPMVGPWSGGRPQNRCPLPRNHLKSLHYQKVTILTPLANILTGVVAGHCYESLKRHLSLITGHKSYLISKSALKLPKIRSLLELLAKLPVLKSLNVQTKFAQLSKVFLFSFFHQTFSLKDPKESPT
jgi:hypothetical protein